MIISPESAVLRRQLVMELQKQKALREPAIAAAFIAIESQGVIMCGEQKRAIGTKHEYW